MFGVFREPASALSRDRSGTSRDAGRNGRRPVGVRFSPELGGPEKTTFAQLGSWTENSDPGVKYYSGTAAYTKTVDAPSSLVRERTARHARFG